MKTKQMQRDIIGACIDCKKYYQPSCSVYKQERKRPGPAEWCAAFKKK